MRKTFRFLLPSMLLALLGFAANVWSAEYRIGGTNPDALLCQPQGKGPFPAVIHNHGVGVDIQGYQKAVRRGYDLPGICKELAAAGFLTFIPIRHGGSGLRNIPPHKDQVLEAIDYVKKLPEVDPSQIALMGNSRGALLTLMVGVEQKGLKALVIMAVPEIGKNFAKAMSDIAALEAPVLLLVEAGDEPEFQKNFDALAQTMRANNKEVKSIRYDRGGGHNLFHSVGYYMTDVKAFLKDKLSAR